MSFKSKKFFPDKALDFDKVSTPTESFAHSLAAMLGGILDEMEEIKSLEMAERMLEEVLDPELFCLFLCGMHTLHRFPVNIKPSLSDVIALFAGLQRDASLRELTDVGSIFTGYIDKSKIDAFNKITFLRRLMGVCFWINGDSIAETLADAHYKLKRNNFEFNPYVEVVLEKHMDKSYITEDYINFTYGGE